MVKTEDIPSFSDERDCTGSGEVNICFNNNLYGLLLFCSRLLESILVVMSSSVGGHPAVFAPIRELFIFLLQSQKGQLSCYLRFKK